MTPDEQKGERVALAEIVAERRRQDSLAKAGRWDGKSMATVDDGHRLAVLAEEVGEVARALQERDDEAVRRELVQVGAVAVAWLTALTGQCPECGGTAAYPEWQECPDPIHDGPHLAPEKAPPFDLRAAALPTQPRNPGS